MIAAVTAAAVVGSLLQATAWADQPKPFAPPAVPKVPAVAVGKVDPVAVRRAVMPDGTKKPAPVWPAAGAAEVATPTKVGVRVLDRAATTRAKQHAPARR
jgi:hypothetical protein